MIAEKLITYTRSVVAHLTWPENFDTCSIHAKFDTCFFRLSNFFPNYLYKKLLPQNQNGLAQRRRLPKEIGNVKIC